MYHLKKRTQNANKAFNGYNGLINPFIDKIKY